MSWVWWPIIGIAVYIFWRRVRPKSERQRESQVDSNFEDFAKQLANQPDYLGEAATHKHAAKESIKNKEHDVAWSELHKQQSCYMQHANAMGFDAPSALRLVGSVHEEFANVLRLEKKHKDALAQFLYFAACQAKWIPKSKAKKIAAYVNRAKLNETSLDEVEKFVMVQSKNPDLRAIQEKISEWTK